MMQTRRRPTRPSLLFPLLVLVASAAAAGPIEIIDVSGDIMADILVDPWGIAVDAAGNVYVAGYGSDNVFQITPGGVITEIIDSTGDGTGDGLVGPKGIAVDAAGNVYVAGSDSDNAFQITPGGVITEIIGSSGDGTGNGLDHPNGIAVDGSGNVYVAGRSSDNAFQITPGGVITELIDGDGDGIGNQLSFPSGVAVDASGNVYVTGWSSHNAFMITPGGVITEIIDSSGDGMGNQLIGAEAVAVDGPGNVYVTGGRDNAFQITPGGVITEIIDSSGDGMGNGLDSPESIAVDASGNVYVAGDRSDNAFQITPGGGITAIIDDTGDGMGQELEEPLGIAVDASGNVYVTGKESHNAFEITSAGGISEIIDVGAGSTVTGGWLRQPEAIAVDASGKVYVAGNRSHNAFRITPGGAITEILDETGDGLGALEDPEAIAADASGNVYVTGEDSYNAFRITPGGAITEIIDESGDGSNDLDSPTAIAVDGSGNVYVAGRSSHNVFKITPAGTITEIIDFDGDGSSRLRRPSALAVDGSGNVYVTGRDSDNAFQITPGGAITEIIDATGDGSTGLEIPTAIAVDGSGNVYVTGERSDNAFKITPAGGITEILDSTGDGSNDLNGPTAIAADGSGNVYVTGEFSHNVFQITPGGAITEIIDESGDGGGNPLFGPSGIAVGGSGYVYVAGSRSENAFKVCLRPACFTKDFAPEVIGRLAASTLIFTITDGGNPGGLGSLAFFDPLPPGVEVAPTPDASSTCGGSLSPSAGDTSIDFNGGTLGPGETCTVEVDVTSAVLGEYLNTTGDLTSSLGNHGPASATLAVVPIVVDFATASQSNDESVSVAVTAELPAISAVEVLLPVTFGGTAADPADYSPSTSTLVIPAGTTSAALTLSVVDDSVEEFDETMVVTMGTPTGAPAGTTTVHTATIVDNEPPVDTAGAAVAIIDETGDGMGGTLAGPSAIAVDGSGNVYVAGESSYNAFKITPEGVITEIIDENGDGMGKTLESPSAIAVDASGNVYVTGEDSYNVFKITPAGAITEIIDEDGDGSSELEYPSAIAVDGSGNVYVAGADSHNVFKITPAGVITEIIDYAGDGSSRLDEPTAIAVDGSGNVYVTGESSDNAFKITPAGEITEIIDETALSSPSAIAVDGAGNVYVTGYRRAFKITPAGAITEITGGNGDFDRLAGIAVDASGNVYVPDNGTDQAFEITPAGVISEILDDTGDGGGNPLSRPSAIAADGPGYVYVTGEDSHNAFRVCVRAACFSKRFVPEVIGRVATSTLTFTLDNNGNAAALVALAFTDPLPADLQVAPIPNAATTCGGSFSPSAGDPSISFTGGTLDPGATCTVEVDVTSAILGAHPNTTGDLTSNLGNHGPASATLTVVPPPVVAFTTAAQANAESVAGVTVTAQLSKLWGLDVQVPLTFAGTAADPADYSPDVATLVIPAGQLAADLTLTVVGDDLDEANEIVDVTMGTPVNAALGLVIVHTALIQDDDPAPEVEFTSGFQSNAESVSPVTVTAQLSALSGQEVQVPVTFTGTAADPDDYSPSGTTITIPAGQLSADLTLAVVDDDLDEGSELVDVQMGTPVNATPGAITLQTVLIQDNDDPPAVEFTSAAQSNAEDVAAVTVTAQLSAVSGLEVQVPLTFGGTAADPDDYSPSASPIAIPAGQLSADLTLSVVDDGDNENDETVVVTMGAPMNATLGTTTVHTATIEDNDGPSITLLEPDGAGDLADASFTIMWEDADPNDDAKIDLFYDTDASGEDGTAIASDLAEDPDGAGTGNDDFVWDTSAMPGGDYFVYAVIDDGFHPPVVDYSDGPVTVNHPPAITVLEPDGADDTAGDDFLIVWDDADAEEDATIDLYYDDDAGGEDGTFIASTSEDPDGAGDQHLWDTSLVGDDTYFVYAVIDDGVNPPVVDYSAGPVTVDHSIPDCAPPASGDWTVAASCTMTASDTAPGDVIVDPGMVLTIDNGVTLEIDLVNHKLLVQPGGGVLVRPLGTIRQP